MARIDSRGGTIVDAKRGHRPIQLMHPHTGPAPSPGIDEGAAKSHRRRVQRAGARERFSAAFTAARDRAKAAV
jgi:hypothetical protein